jgi:3-hydroxyisobutyrate dehydrogenase-like beta-hydroxyacid dehydrogenase
MKIGFIGPGNIGGRLLGSLPRNGLDLTVRDLDWDAAAVRKGRAKWLVRSTSRRGTKNDWHLVQQQIRLAR